MKKLSRVILIPFSMMLLWGCTKTEGLGGKASIQGKLKANFYSNSLLTMFVGQGVVPDEDVYIVYGTDDAFYDDDIKTNYDGSFQFKYLKPGRYTIFTYENCSPCASGKKEKLIEVEITSKDQAIDLGEILLTKKQ